MPGPECRAPTDHPETLRSPAILSVTVGDLGHFEEVEAEARIALEERTRVLGPDHPDAAPSRDNLVGMLRHRGRDDEADRIG